MLKPRARPAALLLAVCLPLLAAAPSWAAKNKLLGAFDAWDAITTNAGKAKVCFVSSLPAKSRGKYKKRGEASLMVTHWPARKSYNAVSVIAGYTYKKDSEVVAKIGERRFKLSPDGDRAWTENAKADLALVRAMRAGTTMTVSGVSTRGTKTTDIFSLKGFTAAHKAINRACGVK